MTPSDGLVALWLAVLAASGGATPAQTVEARAADLKSLAQKELSPSIIQTWVRANLDVGEVAERLLGNHRQEFSDGQRAEFERLFTELLVARAWAHVELLGDFAITCSADGPQATRCRLRRAKESANARFVLRGDRIVDAHLDGVGLVNDNRAQVDRLVRSHGVDGLLERMRRRVAEEQAPPRPKRRH